MTIQEFNMLDAHQQGQTLWRYGTHLSDRNTNRYSMMLYQIDAFYVEVCFHRKKEEFIAFKTFTGTSQLNPYLNKISISGLLQHNS